MPLTQNRIPGTALDAKVILDRIRFHLRYSIGVRKESATPYALFKAFALAVRQELLDLHHSTEERYKASQTKRVYYLSLEFLIGRSLENNLIALDLYDIFAEAAREFGVELNEIANTEPDAALGNGGLGRLAACFLDSMATLGVPGFGYGINYEYGLFRQQIRRGYQVEMPDHWRMEDSPWQVEMSKDALYIPVYGRVEDGVDRDGNYNPMWMEWRVLVGVPYDVPVVGYGAKTVNYLRLYTARASDEFDIQIFNQGDYIRAVEQKIESEKVSKVLYPSDAIATGRELRLLQEYFLVACSLRDIMDRFREEFDDIRLLSEKVAIQLNDTHPALVIAELMRMLVDERGLEWDLAWQLTKATCGYTNHTLLPEALEKWPVTLLEKVLPRHVQIIYEINTRFLKEVERRWPHNGGMAQRMSLIEEWPEKQVRMAHLAIVGSHSVNGVAALHSDLIKSKLVPDFYQLYPARFNNKTNGVTQRRWMKVANPGLTRLISDRIGDGWITDLQQLRNLEPYAGDAMFLEEFGRVKHANKLRVAQHVKRDTGIVLDPASMFGVLAKRIHEYKRQLLNVLYIIHQYFRITEEGHTPPSPRTFLLAGKAAPGYFMAKLIIRLVHGVAEVVNSEPKCKDLIRVAFLPDYKVSIAEALIPGANLSEQISTAGKEASGTGNMKFAMNGALTMGTLDGANIEILEEVGAENLYIFGLTAEQVSERRMKGSYNPWKYVETYPEIRRVVDALSGNLFCQGEPNLYQPIVDTLTHGGDPYFHFADFYAYVAAQEAAEADYRDAPAWNRRAVLNVARMGKFSSDRTIQQYARDIWKIPVASGSGD
ncbi:MAG: glycogen/starch/alpha-glucan phosphorylase [Bryobacterales bacterium]|nr:glycogen/starch/alpha-glucan phosphorylase [Bryobacterales bacterium]